MQKTKIWGSDQYLKWHLAPGLSVPSFAAAENTAGKSIRVRSLRYTMPRRFASRLAPLRSARLHTLATHKTRSTLQQQKLSSPIPQPMIYSSIGIGYVLINISLMIPGKWPAMVMGFGRLRPSYAKNALREAAHT